METDIKPDIKVINIEFPKMDYKIINIILTENEVQTKLSDNDNIYFTVKKNSSDNKPSLQKSLNNGIKYNEETKKYEIEINSEDTKDMEMNGEYGYDITIFYGGNKPEQKVIGKFTIGTKYTINEVV